MTPIPTPGTQRASASDIHTSPARGNSAGRPAQGSIQRPCLDRVYQPIDLRGLTYTELESLAQEVRDELIEIVSINGGHLGASLGTVELTLALHVVFDSPNDKLVWDVGHQAYTHKLITGRRDRFDTIRQEHGLSGFLSRDESEHDAFGAGHASTSISAALGMAVADHLLPKTEGATPSDNRFVAIIGDGALTGGMAFEGLNNAGNLHLPLIVVLNDNEMSIARNVGALSKYLDRVRTDKRYTRAKAEFERLMERLPQGDMMVDFGKRVRASVKEFVYQSMIWEELGFTYIGPVPGHDLRSLVEAMRQARQVNGPVFLHIVTEKGKGHEPAESDANERGHAVSAKPQVTPKATDVIAPPAPPKYQDVFAATAIELANDDPRVVAITAAMPTGTSVSKFAKAHPKRTFDVGIAEQHAVTFAAGLAASGMKPIAAIYSTFLQRAYDQIVHDVCLQRLPVIFAMDRAGFAGDDGRTHHGIYDLTYLRCLPGMTIMAPKDENELRHMLATAVAHDGPIAIRYPRGQGVGVSTDEPLHHLPIGRAELLRDGADVLILAAGAMVLPAERAGDLLAMEGVSAAVVNARFIKPLDDELITRLAERCGAIVTVEENVAQGGFGAGVLELLSERGLTIPTHVQAIPDQIFEQASQSRLRDKAGLTPEGIADAARSVIAHKRSETGREWDLSPSAVAIAD